MTAKMLISNRKNTTDLLNTVLCLGLAGIMIALGDEMKDAIYTGFLFSFQTIIPTLFPFFILSDIWLSVFAVNPDGKIARGFQKMFGINWCGISALSSSLICGFPVGVKVASQLYMEGRITKDELERLSGFVNNPSLAFVISGVGAGILKDVKLGILLYISVALSAILVGLFFRKKEAFPTIINDTPRQSFNITNSIKNAAYSSIHVSSCIVFFSGILGLVSALVNNELVIASTSLFLEVTNAVKIINVSSVFDNLYLRLILTAFALGFSGFSVHMQAFSFLPREASKRKYLLMKLIQAILSSLLVTIILAITK